MKGLLRARRAPKDTASRAAVHYEPQDLFLQHLPLLERAARSAARRAKFSAEEAEDFVSIVKVKCIEDDYRVIRKHRGSSRLTTFLVTVVNNLCRDHSDHLWGKFRPSARAKQLGYAAEVLERLMVRDGMSFETAVIMARERFRVTETSEELEQLAAELPARSRRQFLSDATLEREPSTSEPPDIRLEDARKAATALRVKQVLDEALVSLEPQDLLILQMNLRDGLSIPTIARHLRIQPRSLYPRRRRCFRRLLRHFKDRGLVWEEVSELLGWTNYDLSSPLTENRQWTRNQAADEKDLDGDAS